MDEIPKLKTGETQCRWLAAIKGRALDSITISPSPCPTFSNCQLPCTLIAVSITCGSDKL